MPRPTSSRSAPLTSPAPSSRSTAAAPRRSDARMAYVAGAGEAHGSRAVTALALCFTLNMVGRGISDSFAVFLVPLADEFSWSRASLTGAYAISLLVFGFAAPFAGALLDRYGHRTLYLVGLSCLAITLLLSSALTQLWQVYVLVGGFGGVALASLGMIPA